MDAKFVQGKISFEKRTDNEVYRREIDKVWVQFRGLPNEFKEFLIIWAIGTILGVPRAIDTVFTKSIGRARLKVAMLDPRLIPDFVDVVIRDYVYELQFGVEEESLTGELQLIDLDSTRDEEPKEEDPRGGGPKDDNPNGGISEEKMDVDGKAPGDGKGDPPMNGQQSVAIGAEQLEELGASTKKPKIKPRIILSQSAGAIDGIGAWKATMLPAQNNSGNLNKKISNGTASPVRLSKRNASNVDLDSTEKAARLKAKKNLESTLDKGKLQQPPSFICRYDSSLLNVTQSIGVVLGNNEQDVVNSLKSLKDQEYNRMTGNAKLREDNFVLVEDASTVCSNENSVDLEALNLICSEVVEGLGDGVVIL
jgi:hypothetical protein